MSGGGNSISIFLVSNCSQTLLLEGFGKLFSREVRKLNALVLLDRDFSHGFLCDDRCF